LIARQPRRGARDGKTTDVVALCATDPALQTQARDVARDMSMNL
jgi:hypothetical protein